VLVVNPNSSPGVTARIDAAAQAAALPGERVRTVAAAGAPALIVTPADGAAAVGAVLAAVARHGDGVDGIVLASFGDTGLEAVRARVRVPVVGIARAAFAVATTVGARFAIVSFAEAVAPSLRASAEGYGFGAELAGVHVLPGAVWSDPGAIQDELGPALGALCRRVAGQGGVDSLVLGGGPLAGLAARVQPAVSIPVIDGTTAALAMLRLALAPTLAPARG